MTIDTRTDKELLQQAIDIINDIRDRYSEAGDIMKAIDRAGNGEKIDDIRYELQDVLENLN